MRKIAVLTSGGDAPGMNACIRAVVRTAEVRGIVVVGIGHGFRGLMEEDVIPLDARAVAHILQRGGTILDAGRCEEFKEVSGRARALEFLDGESIEGLVVIGGDGSFRGAVALAEEGSVKVVGVPATIDNDIYGTDYCIGFDTAVNTALEAIDRIRDTAEAVDRPFFVEVMGHTTGFIALEVGIAGGAEEVLVPETRTDVQQVCYHLDENFTKGKKSSIIVVAEGDETGGAFRVAAEVGECMGRDYRVVILGHIQRGGSPTARDRVLASKLGVAAVEYLLEGKGGDMVGEVNNQIAITPLPETYSRHKELDSNLLRLVRILAI
jgi:6-phosphofructokinase 1